VQKYDDKIAEYLDKGYAKYSVLIAFRRIFYVSELSTKNLSLVEHECVKIKCDDFSLYVSAIYLVPDVGKRASELLTSVSY
jgi:hypothetical protein